MIVKYPVTTWGNWYPGVRVGLYTSAMTEIPVGAVEPDHIAAWEANGAGYGDFHGVGAGAIGPLNQYVNPAAGVREWSLATPTWTSSPLTVSYQWIVLSFGVYGQIIGGWNLGATQTLTGQPLALTFPPSTLNPGTYPVVRLNTGTG